jgi:hypothetical protein
MWTCSRSKIGSVSIRICRDQWRTNIRCRHDSQCEGVNDFFHSTYIIRTIVEPANMVCWVNVNFRQTSGSQRRDRKACESMCALHSAKKNCKSPVSRFVLSSYGTAVLLLIALLTFIYDSLRTEIANFVYTNLLTAASGFLRAFGTIAGSASPVSNRIPRSGTLSPL